LTQTYSVAPCRGRTAGTQNPPAGGFWDQAARDLQQQEISCSRQPRRHRTANPRIEVQVTESTATHHLGTGEHAAPRVAPPLSACTAHRTGHGTGRRCLHRSSLPAPARTTLMQQQRASCMHHAASMQLMMDDGRAEAGYCIGMVLPPSPSRARRAGHMHACHCMSLHDVSDARCIASHGRPPAVDRMPPPPRRGAAAGAAAARPPAERRLLSPPPCVRDGPTQTTQPILPGAWVANGSARRPAAERCQETRPTAPAY
jgi:hypothetical protein